MQSRRRWISPTASARSTRAESFVQEVGKLQQFMLGTNPASLPGTLEVCWHPKHAAGGDLVNVFTLGPSACSSSWRMTPVSAG